MKKLFLFLFFLNVADVRAEFEFTPNLKKAFISIMGLRLDEAKMLLDKERKENSKNSLTLLYDNYFDFIKAFITEEKKYADTLRLNTERRLRMLDLDRTHSPFLLFSKAEMLIQTAMVKAKFSENVSAALDLHKAYKYAEKNFIQFPTFS